MVRPVETSPRSLARLAGLFQFLEGLTATFGEVIVLGKLIVSGNAPATAANIQGHEQLFWLGFASSVIGVGFHLAWALLIYDLFKPVNRRVSLYAVFAILVGCAIQALTILFYLAPYLVLQGGSSLSGFTTAQLQSLAYAFLRVNAYAFDLYLVFFGLWCVMIGYLIFRSAFMPRILGVLLAIAGVGWMTFLLPPLGIYLFMPYLAGASALGELPVMVWLLVVGVNVKKWEEQAAAWRASSA